MGDYIYTVVFPSGLIHTDMHMMQSLYYELVGFQCSDFSEHINHWVGLLGLGADCIRLCYKLTARCTEGKGDLPSVAPVSVKRKETDFPFGWKTHQFS